jgi:hypothetical protein
MRSVSWFEHWISNEILNWQIFKQTNWIYKLFPSMRGRGEGGGGFRYLPTDPTLLGRKFQMWNKKTINAYAKYWTESSEIIYCMLNTAQRSENIALIGIIIRTCFGRPTSPHYGDLSMDKNCWLPSCSHYEGLSVLGIVRLGSSKGLFCQPW